MCFSRSRGNMKEKPCSGWACTAVMQQNEVSQLVHQHKFGGLQSGTVYGADSASVCSELW